ncbi:MAG: TIGR03915 family putative DNA repair protein [Clostridiales bacterium]|nr:TIGR03915 family putative DNA repair protein [Clostridiales bacterium]
MRCPIYGSSCSKHNTVRHCPGCPLWAQAKTARAERLRQAEVSKREGAPALEEGAGQPGLPDGQAACDGLLLGGTAQAVLPPQQQQKQPQPQKQQQKQQQKQTWISSLKAQNVAYLYDGSLPGFFCCVYESFYLKEQPAAILSLDEAQPTLLQTKVIVTDQGKAGRVRRSIPERISEDALDLIETVFLSCLNQKEIHCLRFLILAYREGSRALNMLGHPDVAPLLNAEKNLLKEAHLLKGFIRFSEYSGVLAANISPKNFVLPFLAQHFCARYAEEDFIIYDKVHKAGLLYENRKKSIVRLQEMPFPEADATEERYRALWKSFYHTIAIEARINPKCRMTNMPKRYWENMTEMAELL